MSGVNILSLKSLAESVSSFEVEDYQRVYVWEPEDIDLVLEDLQNALKDSSEEKHFFGTLILEKYEGGKKAVKVVDGQQRLTTAFLIVAALRDQLEEDKAQLPKVGSRRAVNVWEKAQDFLTFDEDDQNFRLIPNRLLREIMYKTVYPTKKDQAPVPWKKEEGADKPTALNRPFRRAILHIRNKIDEDLKPFKTYEEKLFRVNSLLDVLLDRFTVLAVPTNSIDESLNVFLTLNSRGQELKASDLARGEILKGLGNGLTEEKKLKVHEENLTQWNSLSEMVGDPEVYLRHFLVASECISVTKKTMLREVVKKLTPGEQNPGTELQLAQDFWKSLESGAKTYSRIVTPTMGGKTQAYLELLNSLLASHRVLFLNLLPLLKADQLEEAARLVCVLSFRWRLNNENAQDLEDKFRDLGNEFKANPDFPYLVTKLKQWANDLDPISPRRWNKDQDTGAYTRGLLFMIYFVLERHAEKYWLSDFHLEHIAPQTRTDHWVKAALGLESKSDIDEDDWREFVSAAGNLTLLDPGINRAIKNLPFRAPVGTQRNQASKSPIDKVSEYATSVQRVNRELQHFEEWTSDLIQQRTQWLREMFEILWSIEPTQKVVISFNDWLEGDEN